MILIVVNDRMCSLICNSVYTNTFLEQTTLPYRDIILNLTCAPYKKVQKICDLLNHSKIYQ